MTPGPNAVGPHPQRILAPRRLLPVLVLAQLAGTSSWFAVNAVMPDLQATFGWAPAAVGTLTAAVQIGFMLGTLSFGLLAVSDRYSARRVFLACSIAQATCIVGATLSASSFTALCAWRALTGFFLAGIYPVGMKIASQWFPRGLGTALGLLVGALVLGSASPHALRALSAGWPWQSVFYCVALIALAAGALLFVLIPEPPHAPARVMGLQVRALWTVARDARMRASVFGYFGHMWELYTLWVLTPMILSTRISDARQLSWTAFVVLGAGFIGCVGGGMLAGRWGSARVAAVQLGTSGLCCLFAPCMLTAPFGLFLAWMLLWGLSVSGDSPQFSALNARYAPPALVGSVLTLTISLGFAISTLSIQGFVGLSAHLPLSQLLPALGIGPALGLLAMRRLLDRSR